MDESLDIYRKARNQYAYYADANNDVMLESVKSKLEELENDMQLKYNQYTSYNTQYQIAVAKLREKTPVFTKLQGASVPQKPAGPKRILTIIGALLFTFFIILAIIISKQLLKIVNNNRNVLHFSFFSIYTNRGVCLDIYRTHLLGHIVYSPDMFNATILVSFTLHNGNIRKIPFCRVLLSKYFYMEYRLISFAIPSYILSLVTKNTLYISVRKLKMKDTLSS